MDIRTAEIASALLALLAAGGSLVLLAVVLGGGARGSLAPIVSAVRQSGLWLAWLVAAIATLGSLYFSEVEHFEPCRWCWFQRVAMYPQAVILLIAAIRRDLGVRRYVIPLSVIGAAISTYHYLIEWNPSWEGDSCSLTGPRCSQVWFRELGFVTLAFMALCGFVAIIIQTWLAEPMTERHDDLSDPIPLEQGAP